MGKQLYLIMTMGFGMSFIHLVIECVAALLLLSLR